jgi:hypothetical protein
MVVRNDLDRMNRIDRMEFPILSILFILSNRSRYSLLATRCLGRAG